MNAWRKFANSASEVMILW